MTTPPLSPRLAKPSRWYVAGAGDRGNRTSGIVDLLWHWSYDEGEWVAACAGAGADAGTRAFAEIEKDGPISMAISIGWAGALSHDVAPGQAYQISGVIDARTGERFDVAQWSPAASNQRLVVTNPIVADEQEKRRLAATWSDL